MTQEPAFSSDDLLLVRPNPWVTALAMVPFAAALALVVAGFAVGSAYFSLLPYVVVPGVLVGIFSTTVKWQQRLSPVHVEAGPEGVRVGDRFVPRAQIQAGLVVPGPSPRVLLRRGARLDVELQASSTEEARGLLRAIGLDATQAVADFRALSWALGRRRYGMLIGGGFAAFYLFFMNVLRLGQDHGHAPGLGGATMGLFVAGIVAMLVVFMSPTRLRVGADGLALGWLWTRRFVGYDQIEDVSRFEKGWGRSHVCGVRLQLRTGEEVLVPVTQGDRSSQEIAVIEERIQEAMESFRRGGSAAEAALLRRGERKVTEWVAALRALGTGANADMRTAPVPRERLFRIVEDPAASPPDRAAAAVALGAPGGDLDAEGRARLQLAAKSTAAPRLRFAIETAAGEDQAAVEEALAALEADVTHRDHAS
jgi:hypothetical protein